MEFLKYRKTEYPFNKSWYNNRIILLGDACHPILPYLAQGASQAIEDSYALCQSLKYNFDELCPTKFLKIYTNNRYLKGKVVSKGDMCPPDEILKVNDIVYYDRHAGFTLEIGSDIKTIIKEYDIVVVV